MVPAASAACVKGVRSLACHGDSFFFAPRESRMLYCCRGCLPFSASGTGKAIHLVPRCLMWLVYLLFTQQTLVLFWGERSHLLRASPFLPAERGRRYRDAPSAREVPNGKGQPFRAVSLALCRYIGRESRPRDTRLPVHIRATKTRTPAGYMCITLPIKRRELFTMGSPGDIVRTRGGEIVRGERNSERITSDASREICRPGYNSSRVP